MAVATRLRDVAGPCVPPPSKFIDRPPDRDTFLLTRWCSDTSRRVEWLYRSGDEFRFGQRHTWPHDPDFKLDTYQDWVDVKDPELAEFGFSEQRSVEAAVEYNLPEVERATRHLRETEESAYSDSHSAKLDADFFKGVLSVFSRWFEDEGLAMPPFPADEARTEAERNAWLAYPHLRKPTYTAVAKAALKIRPSRTATGVAKAKRDVEAFIKALRRDGYIPGEKETDIPKERRMAVFRDRVKGFVESGTRPDKPSM